MSWLQRTVMVLAILGLLGSVGMRTANADPINNPGAQLLPVSCDNGNSYLVIVGVGGNGRGTDGVPAFVLGSNSHLMPTQFTFFDPAIGLNQTTTVGQGQRAGQQGDLTNCTATLPDGQGGSILLTVVAFVTPQG